MSVDYSWIYDDSVYKVLIALMRHENDDGSYFKHEWSTEEFVYTKYNANTDRDEVHKVEGVLKGPPTISMSLESNASASSLTLINYTVEHNGTPVGTYFDDLLDTPIEGKKIVFYLVDVLRVSRDGIYAEDSSYPSEDIINAKKVYFGEVSSVSASRDTVTLGLANLIEELDQDIQRYEDDFYSEENAKLPTGLHNHYPKPMCYGYCYNVSPVVKCIVYETVDSDNLPLTGTLYQVTEHECYQIDAVREGGNILWEAAAGYNPNVIVDTDTGSIVIRNGTLDGHGTITCDLYGKITPTDYASTELIPPNTPSVFTVTNASLIAQDIIRRMIGFSAQATGWVNWESFQALEQELAADAAYANTMQVGIYITQVVSALEVISQVLASIRAYLYIDSYNKISVARFKAYDPTDTITPLHYIKQDDILTDSYNLENCEVPNTQVSVSYRQNYTVQSIGEQAYILGIPPEDRDPSEPYDPDWYDIRPEYAAEKQTKIIKNTRSELDDYITAEAADTVDTLLRFESCATIEAEARMKNREVKRKIYSLKARNISVDIRIGDNVRIQHYLYNSNNFVFGTVIGMTQDFVNMITTLEVYV